MEWGFWFGEIEWKYADQVCGSAPANRTLVWVEGDAYMHTYENKEGNQQTRLRIIQREFWSSIFVIMEGAWHFPFLGFSRLSRLCFF